MRREVRTLEAWRIGDTAAEPRSLFTSRRNPGDPAFLSEAECRALAQRVFGFGTRGDMQVRIIGGRGGSLAWARNAVSRSSEQTQLEILVKSYFKGRVGQSSIDRLDDASLRVAVAQAEMLADLGDPQGEPVPFLGPQTYVQKNYLHESTLQLTAAERSRIGRIQAEAAVRADVLSAGTIYLSLANVFLANTRGLFAYMAGSWSRYSVTARNRAESGSGWAGISAGDWSAIDVAALTARAIDKCECSADPVAIEPGRYTLILEPEAVAQLMDVLTAGSVFNHHVADTGNGPYGLKAAKRSKIGLRLLDERLSLIQDPTDPEYDAGSFDNNYGSPVRRAVWFDRGVLTELPGGENGTVDARGFRVSGGNDSIADMIQTTKRGLLVTRFHEPTVLDQNTLVATGVTRDGLWLIENGKVVRPVKNMWFVESPLFVFNRVQQIGKSVRTYGPFTNISAPPIKVGDFNFVSLADAV